MIHGMLISAILAGSMAWQDTDTPVALRVSLGGHKGPVYGLAFAPDGLTLASGGLDRAVRLWDVPSRTERLVLTDFTYPVLSLAYSPDGKRLVTGGGHYANDKESPENAAELKVWDTSNSNIMKQVAALQGHTAQVRAVAYSSDGQTIASGGWDDLIMLWDAETGRRRAVLEGHTSLIVSLDFAPDGKTLASAGGDGTVRLWDVADGREIETLEVGNQIVYGVAFSPDGREVAACCSDGLVPIWDVEADERRRRSAKVAGATLALAYSPDGAMLAVGTGRGSTDIWDPGAGALRLTLRENDAIWSVAFSPDSRLLATGSQDRGAYLKLWDLSEAVDQQPDGD